MSVSVVSTDGRNYHWQSASKPALSRCHFRLPPLSLPHLQHHHHHHRHHHHHHHHRHRRRHFSGEPPTSAWPRRPSEASATNLSVASSWHAGDKAALLTASESFGAFKGSRLSSSPSSLSSGSFSSSSSSSSPYLSARLIGGSSKGVGLKAPGLFLTRDTFTRKMSTSAGGARNPPLEATGNNGNTSTAAAREVKQYLNRTLFPRPSSTLHGYASLYHKLKKLPASHRKTRQRGKTAPPLETNGTSKIPGMLSERQLEETTPSMTESELDDYDDSLEVPLRNPPRVEIHIYVPSGTTTASPLNNSPSSSSSVAYHEDDAQAHHFSTP